LLTAPHYPTPAPVLTRRPVRLADQRIRMKHPAALSALAIALVALGQGEALAVPLIFDAGSQSITTDEVADNSFWVGVDNPGVSVAISGNGSVTVPVGGNSATLGVNATSIGNSLDIGGSNARLIAAEDLYIGYAGASNTLNVTSGGSVQVRSANAGALATSTGNVVNVSGTGVLSTAENIQLGVAGSANTLTLSAGGKVLNTGDAVIGVTAVVETFVIVTVLVLLVVFVV